MAPLEEDPLVSCLMVTADRGAFCRRAVRCFLRQTYPHRELVVVDDGAEDLEPVLRDVPADQLVYVKLDRTPGQVLGHLRNVSLDRARGSVVLQWDDDDWIHPDRIARQLAVLRGGADAVVLHGSLLHLDTPRFFRHPYRGYLPNGWPGSIMHRRDEHRRYPAMRRAEDSVYLRRWGRRRLVQMRDAETHLHIRCYHGGNTWERQHFFSKLRNTPRDLLLYGWHRHVRRDGLGHPRFRLTVPEQAAFAQYVEDSLDLGLFAVSAPTAAQ